jgi:nicotinamide phosphoribosyltransferase
MGGQLLQGITRDTNRFAMKASAACIDGEWREVYKDPITDKGKTSKKGKVTLWQSGNQFQTSVNTPLRGLENGVVWTDVLQTVYRNGRLLIDQSFQDIRDRSEKVF